MSAADPDALYVALVSDPKRLRGLRRMQYRCASRRCLLLDVIETPVGVLLHQKRYKHSAALNATVSSAEGRAANTFDGGNHWKPRAYFLTSAGLRWPDDVATQSLNCDHTPKPAFALKGSWFAADWEAGHAEVRVRRDGSRYAV